MRPRWEEIEKENTWLKTEYFDFDNDNKLIKKYKVESGRLPVFIFLDKRGGEILRISGEVEKKKLLEVINENKNL